VPSKGIVTTSREIVLYYRVVVLRASNNNVIRFESLDCLIL